MSKFKLLNNPQNVTGFLHNTKGLHKAADGQAFQTIYQHGKEPHFNNLRRIELWEHQGTGIRRVGFWLKKSIINFN